MSNINTVQSFWNFAQLNKIKNSAGSQKSLLNSKNKKLVQQCSLQKVWTLDNTPFKASGPFGSLGFKTLPILGHLQNLLFPLYFWGNVSFQSYLIHRLHNSSDIIFSSTSSFSPTCRTTRTGWGKRHFWKILSKFLTNSKYISFVLKFEVFQKAEALLRSCCKYELANTSQLLFQNSQILLENC